LEQISRAYARIIDGVNKLDRRDIAPGSAKTSEATSSRWPSPTANLQGLLLTYR
jgi:hypothetical protein